MQNLDFYIRKKVRDIPPQFAREDPEYFARMSKVQTREEERNMKRASRMLSLIIALCIVSFTVGLVVGIKFTSGSKKDIMDGHTRKAVNNIGKRVSNLIKEGSVKGLNASPTKNNLFSREDFPFVIRLNKEYNKAKSQEIASLLSSKGHTVILSKNIKNYRIFVGPYSNRKEAELCLEKIKGYSEEGYLSNAVIIKR